MAVNRSLARAFTILEFLSAHGAQRLAEVAEGCALPAPTALRMLRSLQELGYASQREGRWRLTARLRGLMPDGAAHRSAQIQLENLARATGKTAFLVVAEGDEALYLQRALPPDSALVATGRIGRRAPLYCTGVGKVLLAARRDAEVTRYLAEYRLKRLTATTLTSKAALRAVLTAIRAQGYGLDREECEPGVFCVAVPVVDAGGAVIAALSVSGARASFDEQHLKSLVARVQAYAHELAHETAGETFC
ncbi:MAG: IclR family transcriptional regulator [Planctomycetota bacterium]|jgi:IclR family KDG regulon transcriptional repressor|nr:IclR family transcriptional regulator [Planctomycetota bacterium]